MGRTYRPWLSYLLLGVFFAVQVPARLAEAEWLRAGLLLLLATVLITLGVRATARERSRRRGAASAPSPEQPAQNERTDQQHRSQHGDQDAGPGQRHENRTEHHHGQAQPPQRTADRPHH
jgi:flagellar biosynthesis/type III secretory pathway M-ring protein FliF/YscJ